jgi:hypothetical protein
MTARKRKDWAVVAVLCVVFLALVATPIVRLERDLDRTSDEVGAQQKAIDDLAQVVEDARTQGADVPAAAEVVEAIDGAEISETITTGPPGEQGPAGEPGRPPTADEIAAAVEAFCAEHDACAGDPGEPGLDAVVTQAALLSAVTGYCEVNVCTGATGPPGEAGRPPTAVEVAQAVSDYCGLTDCTGPAGVDGTDGLDGAPGAQGPPGEQGVQGPAGPAPTQEQVAAAVAEYCTATGACIGPTGPAGPAGADAREVVAIECDPLTAHPGEPVIPQCRPVYG